MKLNQDSTQDTIVDTGCSDASANLYQAVSCSFYDELEALATLHRICTIRYRTETGEAASIESKIINLYTANKSEFLKLQDGTEIRLDRLISVDGKPVSFTNY
ncbi:MULTISPECIES: Rho-binding antiterminator [Trichocoleus]|uniref:Rho-binding antiterminator n=1 Tax=Trichocoleus desertorum GB2-A4 TaxID=2933944 RepID=A0ABV0JFX1_9CYAN|nr:Rho-binding antiterminator [Trichocoleus sp. FACHB-46]